MQPLAYKTIDAIPNLEFHRSYKIPLEDGLAYIRRPHVLAEGLNLTVSDMKNIASYAVQVFKINYIKNHIKSIKSVVLFILRYMRRGMSYETAQEHLHFKSLSKYDFAKQRFKRWKI